MSSPLRALRAFVSKVNVGATDRAMYIRALFTIMGRMDPWADHMRRGDFAAAWAINDADLAARRAAGLPPAWHLPRHLQPVWDGSPVGGRRVLVRCYHGLGDTVQFVRFAGPLRAAGGRGDRVGAGIALV